MKTHNFWHWLITAVWLGLKALLLVDIGIMVLLAGLLFFQREEQFYYLSIGLPLVLLGASIIIINLYEAIAGITDLNYSKNHCPICRQINQDR
ncbi:MAG: hypothetical protein V1858_04570 [Candidatus Gottesmanbacteria bacterium]